MKVYLVGGAVRDKLLGLTGADKDFVVVGSSVDEMLGLGYQQVGKDFPVFLHPKTHEEYALARLERKVATGYQGFVFDTSSTVTLEQDLSRRDLTINAIAQDKRGHLIDPFDGQADLNSGLLRHTSSAFSEDPVRMLRVARFAARFKPFSFKVAHTTHQLMKQMVGSGEVDALMPERVFRELDKALTYQSPSAFFKVLSACGAFAKVFPSVKNKAHQSHHNHFGFLDNLNTDKPHIKFAIWLKDEDKHSIKALCKTIKCPKRYQQLALLTCQFLPLVQNFSNQSSAVIFDFFTNSDALRRKDRFKDLLTVFDLLTFDVSPIVQLRDLLDAIDVSKLDKINIGKAIIAKKKTVIKDFLFKGILNIANISFRKAGINDLDALYQLDRLSDEQYHWRQSFFNHRDSIKIAMIGNQIVGFVMYQTTDRVEIFRIVTHEYFKRQGVATALIEMLKQLNKPIILELRAGNVKAYQLYQKLGFEQISKRKKYYPNGEDAKVMQWSSNKYQNVANNTLP